MGGRRSREGDQSAPGGGGGGGGLLVVALEGGSRHQALVWTRRVRLGYLTASWSYLPDTREAPGCVGEQWVSRKYYCRNFGLM